MNHASLSTTRINCCYETFNRSQWYIRPLLPFNFISTPSSFHIQVTFVPSSQLLTMSFIRSSLFKATANPIRRSAFATTPLRAFTRSALVSNNKKDDGYEEHRVEIEPKIAAVDESFTFEHPEVSFWAFPSMQSMSVGEIPNTWLWSPGHACFFCFKGSRTPVRCFCTCVDTWYDVEMGRQASWSWYAARWFWSTHQANSCIFLYGRQGLPCHWCSSRSW